ncbi:MAG: hypothetical protein KDA42_09795, partial [Planctomycetales bacterium]|nr:hypothetical protein [Planctomycetales bacterium]
AENGGGNLDVEKIAPLIGPTNLKGYTGSEISAALKAASGAAEKLQFEGKWGNEQGGAYKKFCELAEALISVKDPNEPRLQLQSRRNAARKMLDELVGSDAIVGNLQTTGSSWFKWKARTTQGVLLAGPIEDVVEDGAFFAVRMKVNGEEITVMTRDKPNWNVGQNLVVLGAIVDEPQLNLGGYTGAAETVVWTDLSLGTAN